ncbi:MAG: hypothetical protein JNL33_12150 [Betaproteobacteria bacterium]|nr:hypothetical protein [Betaproteobacteria bacterium]MBL8534596.1 hypothetical protein [Betaproteobacteria bacterium]
MNSGFISLLLPTRGRPQLVERLFKSIRETTHQLDRIEVVLYVDEDDAPSHCLADEVLQVVRIVGPPDTMGAYNTKCLERARGDIIMLANDDMVMRTGGWDDRLRQVDLEFADKIYLAYGNDLFKNRAWCTFPVLSRRTCELLAEPYPPVYRGAFIDSHLVDIFQRLQKAGEPRIRYLPDVIFEHLHYRVGKGAFDETYQRRDRFKDDPTFVSLAGTRKSGARRLLRVIHGESPGASDLTPSNPCTAESIAGAVILYTRIFLLDKDLPIRWRAFLWYWFVGRYVAARGWLGPLRR